MISCPDDPERLTSSSAGVVPSPPLDEVAEKATMAGLSLSVMVKVWEDMSPMVAPEGSARETWMVSSSSSTVSSPMTTVMYLVVSPGSKFRVPAVRV